MIRQSMSIPIYMKIDGFIALNLSLNLYRIPLQAFVIPLGSHPKLK